MAAIPAELLDQLQSAIDADAVADQKEADAALMAQATAVAQAAEANARDEAAAARQRASTLGQAAVDAVTRFFAS